MINDFSVFPADPTEGQVGPYWYHEGAQAYFDDVDHYKMIKAMCRLSCIVCDKIKEQRNEGSERRAEFKNIEQLRGHLFHRHRLFMCSLCLEGRKVRYVYMTLDIGDTLSFVYHYSIIKGVGFKVCYDVASEFGFVSVHLI